MLYFFRFYLGGPWNSESTDFWRYLLFIQVKRFFFNNKNNHNKNISSITNRFQSLEVYFKDQQKKTSTTTKTNNNIIISAITYPIWTKFKGFLLNNNNRNDNNKNNNKLGLSCAKLSLALASNLLLWTSFEYDMEMSWKSMKKYKKKLE